MIEIVTDDHYELIQSLFENTDSEIKIISPFLSKKMAKILCDASNKGIKCSFVTRFYLQDFLDGSNSLDGLQDMLDSGVKLYSIIGLHTKLYLFDLDEGIVGSANFTEGGMVRNVELSIHLSDEPALDILQEYYDDIVVKVEKAEDGIISQEMLDDFKARYKNKKSDKLKLDGSKSIMTTIRGAVLDKNARRMKEDAQEVYNEIDRSSKERLSDVVYASLGGEKEPVSYQNLSNIILKFSGSAKARAKGNIPMEMHAFYDDGKNVYISNFSESRKRSAKNIKDKDETFFCMHSFDKNGKPCPMIVGKGVFRKYNEKNDTRKKEWKDYYSWFVDYPFYCVIDRAQIIKAPINCGIPLRELTDDLYAYERQSGEISKRKGR